MLCARLADLALLTLIQTSDGGAIELHTVIREFLREELGTAGLARMHEALLDAAEAGTGSGPGDVTAWWELPGKARYLGNHLIEHMLAAGRVVDAENLAADLRWVWARLQHSGPVAPSTDLALVGTPRAERLQWLIGQAAHLLVP